MTARDDRCEGRRHVFAENRLTDGASVKCRCGGVTATLNDGELSTSVTSGTLGAAGLFVELPPLSIESPIIMPPTAPPS